tara:strand:- start:117 stop:242 length:126 start_codon:yes stop_codon:yes gene_type:complete
MYYSEQNAIHEAEHNLTAAESDLIRGEISFVKPGLFAIVLG